jgi:hypothetical protein
VISSSLLHSITAHVERFFCHPSRRRLPCTPPYGTRHGPARHRLPPAGRGPLLSTHGDPGALYTPGASNRAPSTPRTWAPQRHRHALACKKPTPGFPIAAAPAMGPRRPRFASSPPRASPSRPAGLGPRRRRAWRPRRPEPGRRGFIATLARASHDHGLPQRGCTGHGTPTSTQRHRHAATRLIVSSGFPIPACWPGTPTLTRFTVSSDYPSKACRPGNPRSTPRPRDGQSHKGAVLRVITPGSRGRGPATFPSLSKLVINIQGLMHAAAYEPPNLVLKQSSIVLFFNHHIVKSFILI